jgi:hypothetical protein
MHKNFELDKWRSVQYGLEHVSSALGDLEWDASFLYADAREAKTSIQRTKILAKALGIRRVIGWVKGTLANMGCMGAFEKRHLRMVQANDKRLRKVDGYIARVRAEIKRRAKEKKRGRRP